MHVRRIYSQVGWLSPLLLCSPAPLLLCLLPGGARAFDELIDSPMYKAPDTPGPRVVMVFPEGATQLWLKALGRPEAEMRCRAADAIARARRLGMKGLDATVAPLRAALDGESHLVARLAIARALIALEAREAAPSLLRLTKSSGAEMRNLVEPALAQWDYRPAREVWLERLRDPETPSWSLVLAVRGLGAVGEEKAADALRDIVLSSVRPGPLRVEAARALGTIRTGGLEKDAERLAADASPRGLVARLAAASLLRRHKGEPAVRLLQRLAQDGEPSVAAVALTRLVEIDPKLVPALDRVLASPDANVRSLGAEVLSRLPTEEHVRLLADHLDDADPDVRRKARRSLHALAAKKQLRDRVIKEAMRVLGRGQWRALEQATVLLTQLDHKPAAQRLVGLLTSDRPEVSVTAAWGLRKLAVKDTLPRVVDHVKATAPRAFANRGGPEMLETLDHQLSQLNQLLGQQKYAKADEALRGFIPRPGNETGAPESRAAAVWALGLIHEGKQPPADSPEAESFRQLLRDLERRLNAGNDIPAEFPQVRRMSAIALGRLKAKGALDSLRRYRGDGKPSVDDSVKNACGWAVEKLTGEAMSAPETVRKTQGGWFLAPDK